MAGQIQPGVLIGRIAGATACSKQPPSEWIYSDNGVATAVCQARVFVAIAARRSPANPVPGDALNVEVPQAPQ